MSVNRLDVAVFGIAGVAAVASLFLAFQLFFRFQYVRAGTVVTRVDRLSGRTCVMPCLPTPAPVAPTPSPSPPSLDHQEQRAIAQVQSNPRTQRLIGSAGDGYAWSAVPAAQAVKRGAAPADAGDAFVVCYCDNYGFGWRWEAHIQSAETYYANDNKVLRERYGAKVRPKIVRTAAPAPTPAPVVAVATAEPQPPPQPQPQVQEQRTVSALDVVREYYRLWNQSEYRTMYGMLSPALQTKLPFDKYVKYHSLVTRIDVEATQGYAASVVNVHIVSQDREKDGSISQTTNVGQWHLAWMDNTWKLDSQDAHEVASSRSAAAPVYRVVNTPSTSPADAVRRFYQLLNSASYAAAYDLLSPNFRRGMTFDDWKSGYRTTIESIAAVQNSNDPSRIPLQLVAKDEKNGQVVTKVYEGAWSVVSDGHGGWLLDEGRLHVVRSY